jgi:translation initiation factor eIF-2B subunit epsilon
MILCQFPRLTFADQRIITQGDNVSDLDLSDIGSVTSSEDESETSDDEDGGLASNFSVLASSVSNSLPLSPSTSLAASVDARLESEFKHEVELSLERAFAEGHSVDNAAVELKTLRMASNVPLIRVREAVVGAIVERIDIVEGGGAAQRKEITSVVARWGNLINQIGGVDAVETVSVLQVNELLTTCHGNPLLNLHPGTLRHV